MLRVVLALLVISSIPMPCLAQHRWSLGVSLHATSFRGAATAEDEEVFVRPSGGNAIGVELTRRLGAWEAALVTDYLGSHIEALSDGVVVRASGASFNRGRAGLIVSRSVARFGAAEIVAGAGPVVSWWAANGDGDRTATGGEVRAALRLRSGRLTLDNGLAFAFAPSPFDTTDLPPGYRLRTLRSLAFTARLRYGL